MLYQVYETQRTVMEPVRPRRGRHGGDGRCDRCVSGNDALGSEACCAGCLRAVRFSVFGAKAGLNPNPPQADLR